MAAIFADLPAEVLARIFDACSTRALTALGGTCCAIRRLVNAHVLHVVHERMGFQRRVGLRCWDDGTPLQR